MSIQNKSRQVFIRKTKPLAKNDHVKSSSKRQVKARPFFIFFRGVLISLLCSLQQMSGAGDVDLILVNGNIYR